MKQMQNAKSKLFIAFALIAVGAAAILRMSSSSHLEQAKPVTMSSEVTNSLSLASSETNSPAGAANGHDPRQDLGAFLGSYVLSKTDNEICGAGTDIGKASVRVGFYGAGTDTVFSIGGKLRFMDINAPQRVEPPYEGDRRQCGYVRTSVSENGILKVHENMICKGLQITDSTTTVMLSGGTLKYTFHQTSTDESLALSFDANCEWSRAL